LSILIGGYAVGYHGYPRATADLDVWLAVHAANAEKVVAALKEFGFDSPDLSPDLFLKQWQIIQLGAPPARIKLATTISGVDFAECYASRIADVVDGVEVNLIDLNHLKINKRASARRQDMADLEHLP
jgi:hypothetical protein